MDCFEDWPWDICEDFLSGECRDNHCPYLHATELEQVTNIDDEDRIIEFWLIPFKTEAAYIAYEHSVPVNNIARCYGGMGFLTNGAIMRRFVLTPMPDGDTEGYKIDLAFDIPKHRRHARAVELDVGARVGLAQLKDPTVDFRVEDNIRYHLVGTDRRVMSDLKWAVQLAIDGFIAMDDNGMRLWHWSFGFRKWRAPALANAFAETDKEAKVVRVFGVEEGTACLVKLLIDEVARREELYATPDWMQAMDVSLYNEHIEDDASDNNDPLGTEEPECPTCLCPVDDDYVVLGCGHIMCQKCLHRQCAESDKLPILCSAENCERPLVSLSIIETILTIAEMEDLIHRSSMWSRRIMAAHSVCPTPGCEGWVPEGEAVGLRMCTDCLREVCHNCKVPNHAGKSCEEYQESQRAAKEELQKFKDENGIKDCPRCGGPYDKIAGCEHIQCHACGAHFCHICQTLYRNGTDVYAHMNEKHRGWLQRLHAEHEEEERQEEELARRRREEEGRQEEERQGEEVVGDEGVREEDAQDEEDVRDEENAREA